MSRHSTVLAAIVLSAGAAALTACGIGDDPDRPADAGATRDQPPTTVSGSPTAPSAAPAGTACESATPETLSVAAETGPVADRLTTPVALDDVSCVGLYAAARTVPYPGTEPAHVLFRYDSAAWQGVDVGTVLDCRSRGVPATDVAQLTGCR